MTESSASTSGATNRADFWSRTLIQVAIFYAIFSIMPRQVRKPTPDSSARENLPELRNGFAQGTLYDLYVFKSLNKSATVLDFVNEEPVWFLPHLVYQNEPDKTEKKTIVLRLDIGSLLVGDGILNQALSSNNLSGNSESEYSVSSPKQHDAVYTDPQQIRVNANHMKGLDLIHLLVYAVPHFAYKLSRLINQTAMNTSEVIRSIKDLELVPSGSIKLIQYMKAIKEKEGHNLLEGKDSEIEKHDTSREIPHWKNRVDIKMVVDHSDLQPQNLNVPHIRKFMKLLPHRSLYLPILYPSDTWLLENNYVPLNETTLQNHLDLNLTFSTISPFWWMIQAQLNEVFNPEERISSHPFAGLYGHSKKETFMLKRIILDTNPYFLAFSALFMVLHTVFSMLAFKNDISFWRNNTSMEGLSALSIVINFICEIIIALYLLDSEETSFLILLEIFFGVVLSAWKVTKALRVCVQFNRYRIFTLQLESQKDDKESITQSYDAIAIKWMSLVLLPCIIGYAIYSLKFNKHRSWYSYIISTLAGTVYTFGFIMMTPQLYINYRLKSVDHLPWRAFTYKALNTFVDDIAAFVIDMPWMHRLACFRDDLIFVCYLYQRWIYSVDKSRPSEWVDREGYDQIQKRNFTGEPEITSGQLKNDGDKADVLKGIDQSTHLMQRKTLSSVSEFSPKSCPSSFDPLKRD